MSNSLRPCGLYPTGLLCPSDFPGKNTGVSCHFILQGIFPTQRLNQHLLFGRRILYHWATGEDRIQWIKCPKGDDESESHSVISSSLWPHGLYSPWHSPGQNTGVGSLSLLQGIFPTQGSNPGLPHCRHILYQLSHKGSHKGDGNLG